MNMGCRNMLAVLSLCLMTGAAQAQDAGPSLAAPTPQQPVSEFWLNPGFFAYHFQRDRHLNNDAAGLGMEYRFSQAGAVTAGVYHNSNWHTSHYVAYYWRPLALGPMRFGLIGGAVDGYPGTRKGGWFPAVLPTASVQYGRIGMNVFYIPSYQNSVNGSITFQLKVRIF